MITFTLKTWLCLLLTLDLFRFVYLVWFICLLFLFLLCSFLFMLCLSLFSLTRNLSMRKRIADGDGVLWCLYTQNLHINTLSVLCLCHIKLFQHYLSNKWVLRVLDWVLFFFVILLVDYWTKCPQASSHNFNGPLYFSTFCVLLFSFTRQKLRQSNIVIEPKIPVNRYITES